MDNLIKIKWCPQPESNWPPLPYHGSALPTKLCGRDSIINKNLIYSCFK